MFVFRVDNSNYKEYLEILDECGVVWNGGDSLKEFFPKDIEFRPLSLSICKKYTLLYSDTWEDDEVIPIEEFKNRLLEFKKSIQNKGVL